MAKLGTVSFNCGATKKVRKDYPDALPFGIKIDTFADKGGCAYMVVSDGGHIKRVRLVDGKVFDMVKTGTPTTIKDFVDMLDARYPDAWDFIKIDMTILPDTASAQK